MPPRPSAKKTDPVADATPDGVPTPHRVPAYPQVEAVKYGDGAPELTVEEIKDRLGWTEVEGADYLFKDRDGKKVVTTRNAHNRPFDPQHAESLMRKHLLRLWVLNGQPRIFDEYGDVQTGQHSLVSCVWAEQERAKDPEKWRPYWGDGPVTMPTIVVQGVKATKEVVASQDTGKPQTFTDLVYRSDYFADLKSKPRFAASRALEYAVRFLYKRVRSDAAAYSPGKTLEGFDRFVQDHPRSLKAVRHVLEEDGDKGITEYVGLGTAAGLLYLMAASLSDGAAYHGDELPREELLDLDRPPATGDGEEGVYDLACQFWSMVASTGDPDFNGVRKALGLFAEQPEGKPPVGSLNGESAVNTVVRAWGEFLGGATAPKHKLVQQAYEQDEDGEWRATGDAQRFDGIDRGNPKDEQEDEEAENGFGDHEPDPETAAKVEAEKAKVKAEALAAKTGSAKGTSVVTGKAVPKADGQALDPLPSSKPKRAVAPSANGTSDKCPKAKDGKHSYLPGPGNQPGKECANCGAPNPATGKAPKAAPKRGGTGK